MKTQIDINCPDCPSSSLSIHGIKIYGKQNYQCKDCKRQFIGDHAITYQGCHSKIEDRIQNTTDDRSRLRHQRHSRYDLS